MSMEFANRVCPNCKNPNYVVFLGDFSKTYKYKCMNCNGYFNDRDFGTELRENGEVGMTEREDTIERIERVLKLTHKKSITVTIPRLTAERAVFMLKEHEEVKPVPPIDESDLWRCGYCHHQIMRCTHQRFCEECGRKIGWEDM